MTAPPDITWKSWAMVSTLGFVWGGTFLVTEVALTGMSPFWVAAARIAFAALLMTAVWAMRGFALFHERPDVHTRASVLILAALSSAIPFSLLAWGQQYVTAGFAGVSMASVGLVVLPLAHFLVPGERLTLRRLIGFGIGFVGVAVLIGGEAFETTGATLETPGRLACVGAASCYALGSVLLRRLPAVDPIGLATILLILAAFMVVPLALIVEGLPPVPTPMILAVLAFLGLIPTAAANILRVLTIRTAGPVFMSLTNYQVPVWSVLLGAWLLSEPLPPTLLYAMALILTGVAISQLGALTRLFRKRY